MQRILEVHTTPFRCLMAFRIFFDPPVPSHYGDASCPSKSACFIFNKPSGTVT